MPHCVRNRGAAGPSRDHRGVTVPGPIKIRVQADRRAFKVWRRDLAEVCPHKALGGVATRGPGWHGQGFAQRPRVAVQRDTKEIRSKTRGDSKGEFKLYSDSCIQVQDSRKQSSHRGPNFLTPRRPDAKTLQSLFRLGGGWLVGHSVQPRQRPGQLCIYKVPKTDLRQTNSLPGRAAAPRTRFDRHTISETQRRLVELRRISAQRWRCGNTTAPRDGQLLDVRSRGRVCVFLRHSEQPFLALLLVARKSEQRVGLK